MSEPIVHLEAEAWEREVLGAERVVVDFYSTECPPCEALAPKFEALAGLYGQDVKFVKIFRQGNRALAEALGVRASPTVLFFQRGQRVGEVLGGPIKRSALVRNLDALVGEARAAELRARQPHRVTETEALILGAGPAGLTAAVYLAQAKVPTLVVDPQLAGGYVATTHLVSNYPGFEKPIEGFMLAHKMGEQAKAAGAGLRLAVEVTRVDLRAREVELDGVETVRARKLILATGTRPRPLGVQGELEYAGRGISYCATCDAKYYQDKDVVVIGGGNSAVEESLFIARFARRLTIVHQFAELQANQEAQARARATPNIDFLFQHEPRAFLHDGQTVDRVEVEDLRTQARRTLACHGVFVFAGLMPNLEALGPGLALDGYGYVKTDALMHTNLPHVFAAGDLASKPYRQITVAVAEGTVAAMTAARELEAERGARDLR
ncbi:MAG TPA: FAD-dependent oxidoreductase [Myxococcota bacterium]|nr:FAD-dependent oxidoreductase [Myxococcota bacterium]HRY95358.1 FAD-dependent oxidoreductase [Myxococcota bacterium]HSA22214.1 FAD-dependent oxidoreductase [Myxococcota bacterium]